MNIRITDKVEQLSKGLLAELLPQINARLISSKSKIENEVKRIVQQRLMATDTYKELASNSKLTNLFGFPAGSESTRAESIVQEIMKGVRIQLDEYRVKSAVTIGGKLIIEVNWGGVFKNPDGIVTTEAGDKVEWIKWLLLHGNKWEISSEYATLYTSAKTFKGSRAHHSLQILSRNPHLIRYVPSQFAGVENDNWIVRTLNQDYSNEITELILSHIISS